MALQEVHDANLVCYPACLQELRAKAPRLLLGGAGKEEPMETIPEENALHPDKKTESRRAEAGPGVLGKTLTLVPSHFGTGVQTAMRKSCVPKEGNGSERERQREGSL